mmetsp:Transcript_50757/g.122398  ORF Transcript_50757/g.122398 Transcript_50757/m.122398 type:complete len:247 (+) Transcript_50757:231-971(+)
MDDGFVPTGSKPLFGGAMSCSFPSTGWIDISDVRQVPDNQESFMEDPNLSGGRNPAQIVVEIVEYQQDVPNDRAIRFFWDNLLEDNKINPNDRNSSTFQEMPLIPAAPSSSLSPPSTVPSDQETTVVPSLWTTYGHRDESKSNTPTIRYGVGYQRIALGRDTDIDGHNRSGQQEVVCVIVNLAVIRLPQQESEILISLSRPVPSHPNSGNEVHLPTMDNQNLDEMIHPVWLEVVTTLRVNEWSLFG